ncbi:elongation factor G [Methylobacterium frigidaeris]|uniref:Elongation factor G n=1 Tax=Methylobacterium frigidaeris TaxID=2038277 RepID=A0AA37HB50_9HYPH|nr:elongation factor G [Methylobacterium frigidaeris]PIK68511.1 elongation factor G [Methylobacterium frigidaeris]GJD62742.1 Elongation factor G [Methylobacterium frigidaeris]
MAAQHRCIAIVGPFQSGKTALLEAILHRTGAIDRPGRAGSRVGDTSPEARAHGMSVEPAFATARFLDEGFTFIDCPGSIEFAHDLRAVLPACDAAIVVCEADERKLPALELTLRELEAAGIPRLLFINKAETAPGSLRDALALLQPASRVPLLMRQIPLIEGEAAVGFIDLALERAFIWREQAPSEVVALPDGELPREKAERYTMLERLADHDDALMEDLIAEVEPERDRIFADLASELRQGQVVSVLFGSAEHGHGITRLLKAVRHEAPGLSETRARLGVAEEGAPLVQVMKTLHTGFGGKLSVGRVLRGAVREGDAVTGSGGAARVAGLTQLAGAAGSRVPEAQEGEVAGLAKLDPIATAETLTTGAEAPAALVHLPPPEPVHALALRVRDRKDDVRLSAALTKLADEDPALLVEHRAELGDLRLSGQGEMHLRVAVERLASRFGIGVETERARIAYRETIRGPAEARARHKKQTGGHGQFADVALAVRPLPRGEGFLFEDEVVGGAVPRQYIASVEAGARAFTTKGPLGFPVVDIAVTLKDGAAHAVDSSDAAFQAATRLAMEDALAKAGPVLLEPILAVSMAVPSGATARATGLVTARRGQILGFDARPGWSGWDVVEALIPEAEMTDLIVELRSATAGVGTFTTRFDHRAELTGRAAEAVLARQPVRKAG